MNAIGGCCGTSPEHIAAIREMASAYPPRQLHAVPPLLRLSGLEPLNYSPKADAMRDTFLMIGERCNVAGSIMYKKAIVDGDYDKAMSIALSQVGRGWPGRALACLSVIAALQSIVLPVCFFPCWLATEDPGIFPSAYGARACDA